MAAPKNRETWLTQCVGRLTPWLAEAGHPVEHPVRITCGWPARGALRKTKKTIGECWKPEVSEDKTVEVFISPAISDPVIVAATVAHELIHAAGLYKHDRAFSKVASELGLEGKPTATVAGDAFKQRVAIVLERLGPYPHATMNPLAQHKAQSTRLIKVVCPECDAEEDPYIVRMSQKTLDRGAPYCPLHKKTQMEVE